MRLVTKNKDISSSNHVELSTNHQKLIDATIETIAKRGLGETTISHVAQAAKVSQGYANFRFKSKENLLLSSLKFISDEYKKSWGKIFEDQNIIPKERVLKIIENDLIQSIVFTNHGECVLGVFDESCIMINFALEDLKIVLAEEIEKEKEAGVGIRAIQNGSKELGDALIDDINNELGMNTEYNSVFIHTSGEAGNALETSGTVTGRGSVSVVYTMPKQSTDFIFPDLTGKLLPKIIRDSGGFYDVAKQLSGETGSEISFSMIPQVDRMFYSLKVSKVYSNYTPDFQRFEIVDPLEYLNVNELKRSGYFSGGYYPLNSLIQVVIVTDQPITIESISTNEIKQLLTVEDVSTNGYFVESNSGNNIDLRYLFGDKQSVAQNELTIKLVGMNDNTPTEIQSNENLGGGCLIATAAFGNEMAPQVQFLRELRDNTVLQTQSGTSFMTGFNQFYYSFSPTVADYERENPMFKDCLLYTSPSPRDS